MDLLLTSGIQAVEGGCESFCQVIAASGAKLPVNLCGQDLLLPKLACAVINHIQASMEQGDYRLLTAFAETSLRERVCPRIPVFTAKPTYKFVFAIRFASTAFFASRASNS
jgi:hypothetical protein